MVIIQEKTTEETGFLSSAVHRTTCSMYSLPLVYSRLPFLWEVLKQCQFLIIYTSFYLQLQESNTDRQLIETSPVLQKLTEFEEAIGVIFTHVRLLARAFTLRTVGFNHLTLWVHSKSPHVALLVILLVSQIALFVNKLWMLSLLQKRLEQLLSQPAWLSIPSLAVVSSGYLGKDYRRC